ncbi:MAG: hypothetical protein ACLPX9_16780 [Rhodomicrobium sp.]
MMTDRSLRWLPAVAGVAILVTAGPIAWDRGWGTFIFCIFLYFPTLLVICVGLLLWGLAGNRPEQRRPALATLAVIAVLTPTIFIGVQRVREPVAFWFWYQTHRQLAANFSMTDGIITSWESWGMAGLEYDSYLVSNASDTISSRDAATRWAQQYLSECEIVDGKRMKRGLYILTTMNCGLQ